MLAGFAADNHRDPSEKLEEDACDLSRVEAEGKTKGSIWQMMLILMKEPKLLQWHIMMLLLYFAFSVAVLLNTENG